MNIKEIFESNTTDIRFFTPVGTVSLSADKCRLSFLAKKYREIVESAGEKFASYCKEEPSGQEDLIKIYEMFFVCLKDIFKEMKKDIASMGNYDIDDDTILACLPLIHWRFEAIWAALNDAILNEASQTPSISYKGLYSEAVGLFRKNVGVDVEDYIMDVGVIAALHSSFRDILYPLVNMLFMFVDARNNLNESDEEIISEVKDHIYDIYGTDAEREKCKRLLSNIRQDIIPKEQVGELLLYIAQINPFSLDIYTSIVRYFGDENKEVQALADYLGFGSNIISYKEKLVQKFFENLSMETEQDTLDTKEKLEAYYVFMGYDGEDKEELLQKVIDRLEELDRIYRTVDGIICESRSSAELAREELEKIKEFMSHIAAPTSDSLLDYEWELNDSISEFEIRFSSELKPKYLNIMKKYLKDFDEKFCTVGLFKKLDRKSAGQERLVKLIKKCDVSTPDKIAEAYTQMNELLPKVGLERNESEAAQNFLEKSKDELALKFVRENIGNTEEDAKTAKEKLISYCASMNLVIDGNCKCIQYVDKVLADLDLKYRTVDQIVCETRESADCARSELENIREFMKQIPEPTSESLLDYEADLLEKKKVFMNTFKSELNKKYLNQIDSYLTDFDRKFCSVGLFKKVDRKQAGKDKALKYVKKLDLSSPDKVDEAYKLLEEFLPKVGITLEEADVAVQYLEKKKVGKGLLGSVGKIFVR